MPTLLGGHSPATAESWHVIRRSLAESVAIGDLNGDGHPDLVVTGPRSGAVSVLLGRGNGRFRRAVNYPLPGAGDSVAIADLDRTDALTSQSRHSARHRLACTTSKAPRQRREREPRRDRRPPQRPRERHSRGHADRQRTTPRRIRRPRALARRNQRAGISSGSLSEPPRKQAPTEGADELHTPVRRNASVSLTNAHR